MPTWPAGGGGELVRGCEGEPGVAGGGGDRAAQRVLGGGLRRCGEGEDLPRIV